MTHPALGDVHQYQRKDFKKNHGRGEAKCVLPTQGLRSLPPRERK